jgi:hypothetical protein
MLGWMNVSSLTRSFWVATVLACPAARCAESCVFILPQPLPVVTAGSDEIFSAVFAQLPTEAQVLPTEHYYYWQGVSEGRPMRGNLRFANGLRERGELSFSYTCGEESASPHFTKEQGVTLVCDDAFTVRVSFRGRTILFRLHQLPQTPPAATQLLAGEQFVERTYDESGLQFYLIYQRAGNCFNWILDETTPGNFVPLEGNLKHEARTDFVFEVTPQRKLLVGVKESHVRENTAYDGPFDQLADNYGEASGRRALLEKAVPECAGRIDAWGNYRDTKKPQRVGLVPYFIYPDLKEMLAWRNRLPAGGWLERYVSRQGK